MRNLIPIIKETLSSGYKFYFYLWLVVLFLSAISIFFFIREFRLFLALRTSLSKIEESQQNFQPQIIKMKNNFKAIDLNKNYAKQTFSISIILDLRDLNKTLQNLEELNNEEDSYFIIEKMSYNMEKDKPPYLLLHGVIIKFN